MNENTAIKQPVSYYQNFLTLRKYLLANINDIEPRLNMSRYRPEGDPEQEYECKTAGCIIGHATGIPEFRQFVSLIQGEIRFTTFSITAFGVLPYTPTWNDLFGPDNSNSIADFIARLDAHLEKTFVQFKKEDISDEN